MTPITRSSPWPNTVGAAAADYKKDFFRNKVFGSVEKLNSQFGNNEDDDEEDEGAETEQGEGEQFLCTSVICHIKR